MKVSEIFRSIQGEGPNVGKPAVFLRMALCNLACGWCDTKYTWDWKTYDYEKEVKEMNDDQVKKEILSFDTKHLVLTGGEPMLQQTQLFQLLKSLKETGFYIEVETNGTVVPVDEMIALIDEWNVSPKLENSGNSLSARERPDCYHFFKRIPNAYFKYVIQDSEDLAEVQLLAEKYAIPLRRIVLMPEARTSEELAERTEWLKNASRQLGYLFSTRLQIELWGNKRGV
jgi:7-cyano-7-deazaguanosine (preQ0) biosynthesis protein QueE